MTTKLTYSRKFSTEHPYHSITAVQRTAQIKDDNGNVLFEQEGIEVPEFWSQLAVNIVASKYFYGEPGTEQREKSVYSLVDRVADAISNYGYDWSYFEDSESTRNFRNDLKYILINQYAAFNSPVWFNVGLYQKGIYGNTGGWHYKNKDTGCVETDDSYKNPQCSACFIQSVYDTMDSIMDLAKKEAMLFKYGSGTGSDLSQIRSAKEKLSGGGKPSGPLSFMRLYDQIAGVIKSGGKTRRAAKMQSLRVDHPDIMEFIECKRKEEEKAKVLIKAGYSYDEAYTTVPYQNANLSVRLTDTFMKAVENDEDWSTAYVTDPYCVCETFKARDIFHKIAENTWACGDPGVQFHDTINRFNTCPENGMIRASNPCVTGDTLVATGNGDIPIKELVDVTCKVYGSDLKLHEISGAFKTGCKPVYRLTTTNGYKIEATGDHLFSTTGGNQKLISIDKPVRLCERVGDKLNIIEDTVESIEYTGERDVYDLTESCTHHFIANGFIVHNCSEYMFLDDSACNLSSINLLKFLDTETGIFDVEKFKDVVTVMFIAQDILVDQSTYPTEEIASNSHKYRPIGIGFSNLGALLMCLGYPYDSEEGRSLAAGVTALLQACAYNASVLLVKVHGIEEDHFYLANEKKITSIFTGYRDKIAEAKCATANDINIKAKAWQLFNLGLSDYGMANAQLSVLAPTGTISFMMDCATTGIEPDIALIKYKQLAGGGVLKMVNNVVPMALKSLKYSEEEINNILKYLEENEYIEGAPGLKEEHLAVFDCAFPAPGGNHRCISWEGHLKMMAACQTYISGAISKTVNMPNSAAVEDIEAAYMMAWKLGLKAVAIYRDGSKAMQPLNLKEEKEEKEVTTEVVIEKKRSVKPKRNKLPDTRNAVTHKFNVAGHKGYITLGLYDDGKIGEMFVTMAKEGSTIGGLMDGFSTAISMGLQYGVPMKSFIDKFAHTRFEPMGYTKNEDIPIAKSIIDYIFRWISITFFNQNLEVSEHKEITQFGEIVKSRTLKKITQEDKQENVSYAEFQDDAPACPVCGSICVRNGNCYLCYNCGQSLGCS